MCSVIPTTRTAVGESVEAEEEGGGAVGKSEGRAVGESEGRDTYSSK